MSSIFRGCLKSKSWEDTHSSSGEQSLGLVGLEKGLEGARVPVVVGARELVEALQRGGQVLLWGEGPGPGRNTFLATSSFCPGRVGQSRHLLYQAALWAEGPCWGPDAALSHC